MNIERLNPLNDYLFMKYMGEKGDEEQLQAFLSAVLQKTGRGNIRSVEIIENKALTAETIGDKNSVLDIRAVIDNGAKVNVEVQLRNLGGNMDKRSLYYWSREFVRGIGSGSDYKELPGVIAINIIDFEFIPVDEVHTSFHLWEDTKKDCMLTDALEIHFIDMVKFRRLPQKDIVNNRLHRWLTFFNRETSETTLNKILAMDTAIQKADQKIKYVSQDEEALRAYEMRIMAISDEISARNYAIAQGRQEGIAIGEKRGEKRGIILGKQEGIALGKQEGIALGAQKERADFIRKLSQSGFPLAEIAAISELSVEEVSNILKENRS